MSSRARLWHMMNVLGCIVVCFLAGGTQAANSEYPSRPVRLVVGFAPGGGADASARIVALKLSELMGQNWLVDNRTGAGGNLASETVARANPDGYTVLLAIDTQLTANPLLYKLPFSVDKDLQPIVMVAASDSVVVVHPTVPAKTIKDLIAFSKQNPGALRYGSGGVGSSNHLMGELLKKVTGIDMVHVPYKGAGPAAAGIVANEVQLLIATPASTIGFITGGRLRALARTGSKRGNLLPEVPTIAESGYPGFDVIQWYGLVVPSATPKRVSERIWKEARSALQSPDVQASMERLGLSAEPTTPAELTARIKKESAMWAGIIKDAGIVAQ
jgi:tripartite-type tricarboxylate transporter receptor subunit TctC